MRSAVFGERFPREAFLSTHRVCGPLVKRCELGAMPRGGAISQTERVRLVEDADLSSVAPARVSTVHLHGATAPPNKRILQAAGAAILGAPPIHSPDSSKGEWPTRIRQTVEGYHAGRPFSFLRSSKAEPSPDKRETAARYRTQPPVSRHWCKSKHGGFLNRRRRRSTGMARLFRSRSVRDARRSAKAEVRGASPRGSTTR